MPKLGKFGVLFGKKVFGIRKQCLAAIEAISRLPSTVFHESIGSYRHVQKILPQGPVESVPLWKKL